jgi:ubiquinone/menaquinone biosynthesis C-methylase UbiE
MGKKEQKRMKIAVVSASNTGQTSIMEIKRRQDMDQHRVWHYIDETQRRQWQDPEAILKKIGLAPGYTFMDIGCGSGFFTLPAARITGTKGKVYGLDSQSSSLDEIRKKAKAEGLKNIELKAATAEETIICHACADIVFLGIVLHDFQDPARVLMNARLMIKPRGILANLDWKKVDMNFGPPLSKRFDEAAASRLIEGAGFQIESTEDSGQYHYLITARPG